MTINNFAGIKSLFLDNLTAKQTIFKNTFWLMLAEGICKVLMFFLAIFIARYLGVENYGKFSFAFAFVALFAVLADFGLSTLTIREVARDKKLAGKYINNIAVIKLILGIITFSLIFVVIQFFNKTPEVKTLVYLVGILIIIQSFTQFFQSIFRAFEKMEYEAVSKIVYSAVLFILVFFAIWQKLGMKLLVQGYIYAALVTLVITLFFVRKRFFKFQVEIDYNFWKRLFKEAWPFAGSLIFVIIYFRIATVILSMTKGDIAVGLYNAAYNIYFSLITVPVIFMGSVYPIFSKLFNSPVGSLKSAYKKSVNYLLIFGLPVAIGNTLLGDRITYLLYGADFAGSGLVLKILGWAFLFLCLSNPSGNLLDAVNKQKVHMIITGFGMAINLLLNLILIFPLSHVGAAIAIATTEAIVFFLVFLIINNSKYKTDIFEAFPQIAGASIVMAFFIILLKNINVILLIGLSAVVYSMVLLILEGILKSRVKSVL